MERKPLAVTISRLDILGQEGGDWLLDVRCSKGTYIRTLCHDIGQALGCGGCMSSLRRLEAGDFSLADAYTLDQVQRAADEGRAEELLLPVDSLFSDYPSFLLRSPRDERRIRSGNVLPAASLPPGQYRVYSNQGAFLALCRAENGELKTIKSFFEV